jgi:hypothetical protein
MLKRCLDEITNPKEVSEGKYKIPHKYLIDALSRQVKYEQEDPSNTDSYIGKVSQYFDLDGKFPQEYGRKIEELYNDSNNYVYMHQTKAPEPEYEESILVDGLKLSTKSSLGPDCYCNIGGTAANLREGGKYICNFMDAMDYGYNSQAIGLYPGEYNEVIIISIPKEKIDRNEPVLGSQYARLSENNPGHILPQYVVRLYKN